MMQFSFSRRPSTQSYYKEKQFVSVTPSNLLHGLLSVCKKESRNENIEMLPSSFSPLYRTNPEDLGQEIPRQHQVTTRSGVGGNGLCFQEDILDICGEEISLYLINKQITVTADSRR